MPRVEDLVRSGGVTLAFDTNAIIGFSRAEGRVTFGAFWRICDDVSRLRDEASEPLSFAIVVPALAHMEVLHDLRAAIGPSRFDRARVERELESKGAAVAPFHDDAAMSASAILHRWFPEEEAWRAAKRARCLEVLGLRDAPGEAGLASIDWAIAAQAEAEGWILVTSDTRAEFGKVSRKIAKSALRQLLDELLRERGLSAPGPITRP
jgi:predicted nucleic acid-binding protein